MNSRFLKFFVFFFLLSNQIAVAIEAGGIDRPQSRLSPIQNPPPNRIPWSDCMASVLECNPYVVAEMCTRQLRRDNLECATKALSTAYDLKILYDITQVLLGYMDNNPAKESTYAGKVISNPTI